MTTIKKIRIKGFKSFAQPTEIEFCNNFNMVIGPNGSGKSLLGSSKILLSDGTETRIDELIEEKLESSKVIKLIKDGIYCESEKPIKILSLNKNLMKIENIAISKFIRREGEPYLFEITTRTGKKVTATGCHPVMVFKDEKVQSILVSELNEKEMIASPRIIYTLGNKFNPKVSYLIGALIGDGHIKKEGILFTNQSPELLSEIKEITFNEFNVKPSSIYEKKGSEGAFDLRYTDKSFINYILSFFNTEKINSGTKTISNKLLNSDLDSVSNLIAGLYDTDGSIRKDLDTIEFCSKSKTLVNQLQRLLLRFNIISMQKERICCATNTIKKIKRKYYYLYISGQENLINFYKNIPLKCRYKKDILFERIKNPKKSNTNIDLLPQETNDLIKKAVQLLGIKYKPLRKEYPKLAAYIENRCKPTREGLKEILPILTNKLLEIYAVNLNLKQDQLELVNTMDLIGLSGAYTSQQIGLNKQIIKENWATNKFQAKKENLQNFYNFIKSSVNSKISELKQIMNTIYNLANSDIFWDEIVSIKKVKGEKYVYDLTIPDNHNFIAEGLFVHNSNIMDAFTFVLGGLSAKTMRAEKSSNLIFNGGKKGSAMKEAEVSIFFSNENKEFPIEDDEIRISRIIRQNGQSIYKINNEKRTRQQILELLSLSKVDPTGHNIILQGDIVGFMDMRPEQRREIIEEVSGISIYEERKQKALREIDKVEEKLNNANIILTERAAHLRELKKERDQALRFKENEQRLTDSKATLIHFQLKEKEEKKEETEKKIKENQTEIDKINENISKLKEKIDSFKKEIKVMNFEIEEKGEKEQITLQKEVEDLKTSVVRTSERIQSCNQQLSRIKEREIQLKKNDEEIKEKVEELNKNKKQIQIDIKDYRIEENNLSKELSQFKQKYNLSDFSSLEKFEKELEEKQNKLFLLKETISENSIKRQNLDSELGRIESALKLLKGPELKKLKSDLDSISKQLSQKINENSVYSSQLNHLRTKIATNSEELLRLRARKITSEESLSKDISIRRILSLKDPNIYGTISDLGTVDSKFSTALEVAAGPRMKSIVVKNDVIALKCINFLKKNKLGVATFLPLNKIKQRLKQKDIELLSKKQGVYGLAQDLISFDKKFKNIFSYVFGSTLVVEDIDVARRIGVGRARMVSLEGDLFEPFGAMIGGYRSKIFSKFKEKDTESRLDKFEKETLRLKENINSLQKSKSAIEKDIDDLRTKRSEIEAEIIKIEKSIDTNNIDKLDKSKNQITNEIKQIDSDIKDRQQQIQKISSSLIKLKQEREKINQQVKSVSNSGVVGTLQELEDKKEKITEKIIRAESEINNIENQIKTIYEPEREKVIKILNLQQKEYGSFSQELSNLKQSLDSENKELKEKQKKEKQFYSDYKNLFTKRNKLNEEIQKYENKISSSDFKIREFEKRVNEVSLKRAKLVAEVEGLQKEFEQFENPKIRRGINQEQLRTESSILEKELKKMGNVNLKALEIYEGIEGEYEKLVEKSEVLKKEKEDVLKLMLEIESKKKTVFIKTFKEINENFMRIFLNLSEKGEAFLHLENKDDPLNGGLDIIVKLASTKCLDIRSLSGGEKTMTALAFIFAIQEFKPASFYLFDEVDAALDKTNSALLAKLVNKYSTAAQYVMISHNDHIITEANQIYGVSMQKNGISKIISLKL